nr:hypothetical protein [Nocardioides convexus]
MSVYDNVAFPLRAHTKKGETEVREIAMQKLDMVGLLGQEHKAARRDLRRHAQARRPGPLAGHRAGDHPVRRAGLRPRPGAHGEPRPACSST